MLVSHSAALVSGVAELAAQVAGEDVPIVAIGGMDNGTLGTDGERVLQTLKRCASGAGCVVLMDIGSSVLAVRAATQELSGAERHAVLIVDAPLVEGAVAAAVAASTGASLEDVGRAAVDARDVSKF